MYKHESWYTDRRALTRAASAIAEEAGAVKPEDGPEVVEALGSTDEESVAINFPDSVEATEWKSCQRKICLKRNYCIGSVHSEIIDWNIFKM